MSYRLPRNLSLWQKAITTAGLGNTTIHDVEPKSASKFEYNDYLLLRAFFKTCLQTDFVEKDFDLDLEPARKVLASDKYWNDYLQNVNLGQSEFLAGVIPDLGTFSLPLFYQKEATRLPEDAPGSLSEDAIISPISKRTRLGQLAKQQYQDQQLSTPTKSTTTIRSLTYTESANKSDNENNNEREPLTPTRFTATIRRLTYTESANEDDNDGDDNGDDNGDDSFFLPEQSPTTKANAPPPSKDEQLVNFALVLLANALTIHRPLQHKWTADRVAFKASFAKSSFQARTDGYLEDHNGKIRALVEVKPYLLQRNSIHARMQQTAQVVAWILNSIEDYSGERGQRLLISQCRDEIYLIFAEYDNNYIKYLKNDLDPNAPPLSFLTMQEFGPWDTSSKEHMTRVSEIILAYTMRSKQRFCL